MKKIIVICIAIFLTACGLQYTPSITTSSVNNINFVTDLKKEEKKCGYGLFTFPPFAGSDISVATIAKKNGFKKVLLSRSSSQLLYLI